MFKVNNVSLNRGSFVVVSIFTAIVLIVGGLGAYGIGNSLMSLNTLNKVNIQQKTQLNITNTKLLELRILIQEHEVEKARKQLASTRQVFTNFLSMDIPYAHKDKVEQVKARFESYLDEGLEPQIEALERNDLQAYAAMKPKVVSLGDSFYTDAVKYFVYTENEGSSLYTDFKDTATDLAILIGIAILVALGLIVIVLKNIRSGLIRPLETAVLECERMAEGDLSNFIHHEGSNEIAKLLQAMHKMQVDLSSTFRKVSDASDDIYSDVHMIARGNADLASRTEEQAASLEQIASSMEQLTATVGNNAENSGQANKLAHTTSDMAEQGGVVVSQVISTMDAISTSSGEVVGIIDVIDSIAFQTNILALNAAVEAARAGESGRGFAVVASEVRLLASRSGEAAKQIRELLQKSASRIDSGSRLVSKAGETMTNIVDSVRQVTTIMNEIASASREQSDGIAQVNQAISQMDQVTQQNAGMVQEAANAAQALEHTANELQQAVKAFKLG
jgi:methyl-accepting chemotaxis protein-2 (aspartate sensor receptor)